MDSLFIVRVNAHQADVDDFLYTQIARTIAESEAGGFGVRRRTKMGGLFSSAIALITLAAVLLPPTVALSAPSDSSVDTQLTALGNPSFFDSSFAVVPGTTVSLHWSGGSTSLLGSGVHLLITSSLPGFSSATVTQWPSYVSPAPAWNGSGWITTATAMNVFIPLDAAPGTQYQVGVEACSATECVTPAKTAMLNVPASSTQWTARPYQTDFSQATNFPAPGDPFATTFLRSTNSIWNASEFSHDVIEIPSAAKRSVVTFPVPTGGSRAFRQPFSACYARCEPSETSALSEQVTTSNGWIWTTFGGWRVYAGGQRDAGIGTNAPGLSRLPVATNQSEVVAFDPATRRFCTYLVPGNNTQVAGVVAIGQAPRTQVWFVASSGPTGVGSLDEFNPSSVGQGCTGRTDKYYPLPTSVVRMRWPKTGGQWPVQIASDPTSRTLWITNFNPYLAKGVLTSAVDRVDISDPDHPKVVRRYAYPSANASTYFGAKPWNVVAPPGSNYVYVIDNGDAELVRINRVTNQLQEVPIPLTSDVENGFGLAVRSGRLYFALANDYHQTDLRFGPGSTFGYIDLSSWSDDGPPAQGVVYTGLAAVTDPGAWANYRSIAVGPTGEIALTDGSGVIRLTPRATPG